MKVIERKKPIAQSKTYRKSHRGRRMTNETKYTKEDLKAMQAWDFERKIRVTQTRIIEWYKH